MGSILLALVGIRILYHTCGWNGMDLKKNRANFITCCVKMATTNLNYIFFGQIQELADLWKLNYLMIINHHMNQYFDGKICKGLHNFLKYLARLKQRQVCDERANYFLLMVPNIALYVYKMSACIHTCLQSALLLVRLQSQEMPFCSPYKKVSHYHYAL